jgi:hypothetical protein
MEKTAEKRSRVKKRAVKFCPKCGSTDIFFASGLPQLRSIILEDGKLAAKLEEEYAKRTVKE